jgi:hypothetical protein
LYPQERSAYEHFDFVAKGALFEGDEIVNAVLPFSSDRMRVEALLRRRLFRAGRNGG